MVRRGAAVAAAVLCALTAVAGPVHGAARWLAPVRITPVAADVDLPHLAISADGTTAVAVWLQNRSGTRSVLSSVGLTSAGTTSWGDPAVVATGAAGNTQGLQVALSANGGVVVVVWVSGRSVRARTGRVVDLDVLWGRATTIDARSGTPSWPRLVMNARGTSATATWLSAEQAGQVVRSASAVIGRDRESWGTAQVLARTKGDALGNSLAASSDGSRVLSSWTSGARDARRAFAVIGSVRGTTSVWGRVLPISTTGARAAEPVATLNGSGTSATTVWQETSTGPAPIGLMSSTATVTGTDARWGTPVRMTADQLNPQLPAVSAASESSRVVAVWVYPAAAAPPVYGGYATVAGRKATWSAPVGIGAPVTSASEVDVAIDAQGSRAVATWLQQAPGTARFQVWSSSAASGRWSPGAAVPVSQEGALRSPRVALSADGSVALAVWISKTSADAASPGVIEAATQLLR